MSVVVHPYEADVEHIHEAVPEAAYLGAAGLSVAERLEFEDALGESGEEVFDLSVVPAVHLPRLDELLGDVEEEVAQFS